MVNGTSYNVIRMNEVGVNELVKDIFKRQISALARVPIDQIPLHRIKELAAKDIMQDPHHVLSSKTVTPAWSEPVSVGYSQAEFATALTVALASF